MRRKQMTLPIGPIRNNNLFSNHWLENRLCLEPEWEEVRQEAESILDRLADLWKRERDRVAEYGDEAGLEHAFIQPVLETLGWRLKYQTFLRGRKPDYALFLDDASLRRSLKAGRTSPSFWNHPIALADAKRWDHTLDRPVMVKRRRKYHREYPPEQMEWYLQQSQLNYAIITNGRLWRLIPRTLTPEQPRFETYIECDLARILDRWAGTDTRGTTDGLLERPHNLDDFLRFYLFFSPAAFLRTDERAALIERAAKGSSEYRLGVGEGLKEQVFKALRISIEGFLTFGRNNLDPERDRAHCHEESFILLYRLLFIMYAEDRRLLPYRVNGLYTENRSLSRFRDQLAGRLDRIADGREEDYSCDSTDIWRELQSLFDLIDVGGARYGVPAYNGGLFDREQHPFLAEKALPDCHLARVIDCLGRAIDAKHPKADLCRVDYRDLAIQHLGTIYEGLLELRSHYATEPMVIVRRRGNSQENAIREADPTPDEFERTQERYQPGQVYLLTEKGERRSTGSYYTPNHIVDYIVEKTLGPLCRRTKAELEAEIQKAEDAWARARGVKRDERAWKLQQLRTSFDDRILGLRVLDPAMGSGHFLLSACRYLAEEIATNPLTGDPKADELRGDESTLTYWKRRLVERCLYGVDMNPLAVELAKLALWLETVSVGRPLSFLDHHLRYGNSLVGATLQSVATLPGAPKGMSQLFAAKVESRLPALLGPLNAIRNMTSETADQVKKKEKLFRKVLQPVRVPFIAIADAWCAAFFAPSGHQPLPANYDKAIAAIGSRGIKAVLGEPWLLKAQAAVRSPDVAAFHWELEFPEVFFDSTHRRPEAGFDAVIGNPPYDVLSEKETGKDLSQLRAFLKSQAVYTPSFRGKNNLYKLFLCRALDLLAEGGRLGFITPMAFLGDVQAADLRREILDRAAFTSVESFPQKDDPDKRIFREAKLSTVVFTVTKTEQASARAEPFTIRVHPGKTIREDSPCVRLTTADIPQYDPANCTIVSCSQDDWELALRIFSCKRQVRLGDVAVSYQGEVNEVTCKEFINYGGQGQLILRGASVCLYATREASQGKPSYLDVKSFLRGKRPNTKAFAYKSNRLGFQRMSPQNNFRRLILAPIPAGAFCFDSISYFTCESVRVPFELVMAVFNSKLADWYFRLGSTNATINEYQVNNLPCPVVRSGTKAEDRRMLDRARAAVAQGDFETAFAALRPGLAQPPFSPAVRDVIVDLVNRIVATEAARGEIPRAARSALDPAAQPLQDFIDRLIYAMAGLNEQEIHGLEQRYKTML